LKLHNFRDFIVLIPAGAEAPGTNTFDTFLRNQHPLKVI
jgi:hypothetical protein